MSGDANAIDQAALAPYLEAHIPGFAGLSAIEKFKSGQSNPTYLLTAASGRYVLRAKPPGQLLKSAQLSWITYRDSEFKLIDSIYDGIQGTMYIPMRIDEKMQIVKQRALALASHVDMLDEAEP